MALSDAQSPSVGGNMKANGFITPWGMAMPKIVMTNGTTRVNVFGSTNGFKGTFLGFTTLATDSTGGIITLKHSVSSGAPTHTVAAVNKGPFMGSMAGSFFTGTAFFQDGTATVESSGTANAAVILYFTAANPGE